MSDDNASKPIHSDSLAAAQYTALRDEILERIRIKVQVLSLTLLVAGTFLTLGVQPSIPVLVLLVYPILALFLAARYSQNDLRIYQLSLFIRTELERDLEPGWEKYRQARRFKNSWGPLGVLDLFSTCGLFLCTQALAIGITIARLIFPAAGPVVFSLLVVDVLVVVLTFFLLLPAEHPSRSPHAPMGEEPNSKGNQNITTLPPDEPLAA